MSVIANPFNSTPTDWAFYVIDAEGRILGMSNSYEWCEWLITKLA